MNSAASLPAVARIVNTSGRCRSYATGTLVHKDAERGIVITVAHLFRDGVGELSVTFPGGVARSAELLSIDTTWDLAALAISRPDSVEPTPIADAFPQQGAWLRSCGYGSDGQLLCNRGQALGYATTPGGTTYETLQLTGSARLGDSGGPVLNERGELAAVLWGTDGHQVSSTYCGRVRKFLRNLIPPIPSPPPAQQPPHASLPNAPGSLPPARSESRSAAGPLEEILQRLNGLDAAISETDRHWLDRHASADGRLENLEQAMTLADGLPTRLDHLGERLDGLAAVPQHAVAPEGLMAVLSAALPTALTALGWSTPPSLAVLVGLRMLSAWRRRRSGAKRQALPRRQESPLNDDYAKQLNSVFALSGRSPVSDATLGREYDELLAGYEESSDGTTAAMAKKVRDAVAQKFFRIHGRNPMPVEPVEE